MASNQPNQFDTTKSNAGSNPGQKVRFVAKVRAAEFGAGSSRTVEWISVNKPCGDKSEGVTISFNEQCSSRKESYVVDYCYKEYEENEIIYSREVKPFISAVFQGHNSTVIAYGARGSGKTHVIQGSAERPGLAVLATAELLSMSEQNGKSLAVSFYEIDHQEHAVDLLNPEQPLILVFEDRGRIQFKGLSQVPVKSIAEFQNLYFTASSARKAAPKKGNERAGRSHMGLIVHVFSRNESVETGCASKMNFVDLAGYEDARKKSSDATCLAETNKINKSLYALLNVCHALRMNESRAPYRESKLTHMLQDSLRRTSKILMVACLNPSFCQDTIYMISLASRSCQWIHRAFFDSTKKSGGSTRQMMISSHKSQTLKSVLTTAKKGSSTKSHIYEKKATGVMKSAVKARILFDESSHSAKAEKDNSLAEAGNHAEPSPGVKKDNSFPDVSNDVKPNLMVGNNDSSSDIGSQAELYPVVEKGISVDEEDQREKQSPYASNYSKALSIVQEGRCHNMNKENNSSMADEEGSPPISSQLPDLSNSFDMIEENNSLMANEERSPPISSQLRDLSNNLKLLCSSTPLCMQIPEKECISFDDQMSTDIAEPKTPVNEQNVRVDDRWDVMNGKSPWETFSMRGSGMKNSLVQEYLRFLNTANKEELKKLKGIGDKRATYILELREESPEPFKSLDDLKDIGLSAKQIKGMMKKEVGVLFN